MSSPRATKHILLRSVLLVFKFQVLALLIPFENLVGNLGEGYDDVFVFQFFLSKRT